MNKWFVKVIVLVVLIAIGITIPVVRSIFTAPKDMLDAVSTGIEIKQIETMILGFQKKYDRWPAEGEFDEMVLERFNKDRTDGLMSHSLVDMWGEPYGYFRKGSGFVLQSTGPDRKPSTTDDVILLRR